MKKKKYKFDDGYEYEFNVPPLNNLVADIDDYIYESDDYDGKDIGSATYDELQLQNMPRSK